jgi:hypothetical protein
LAKSINYEKEEEEGSYRRCESSKRKGGRNKNPDHFGRRVLDFHFVHDGSTVIGNQDFTVAGLNHLIHGLGAKRAAYDISDSYKRGDRTRKERKEGEKQKEKMKMQKKSESEGQNFFQTQDFA